MFSSPFFPPHEHHFPARPALSSLPASLRESLALPGSVSWSLVTLVPRLPSGPFRFLVLRSLSLSGLRFRWPSSRLVVLPTLFSRSLDFLCRKRHRGNMYLTSHRVINVRRLDHVSSMNVEINVHLQSKACFPREQYIGQCMCGNKCIEAYIRDSQACHAD